MREIPVYLIAGFLDSGKTQFINGILEEGFAREDPTLLLSCEEGEESYEKSALDNVTVVQAEDLPRELVQYGPDGDVLPGEA